MKIQQYCRLYLMHDLKLARNKIESMVNRIETSSENQWN